MKQTAGAKRDQHGRASLPCAMFPGTASSNPAFCMTCWRFDRSVRSDVAARCPVLVRRWGLRESSGARYCPPIVNNRLNIKGVPGSVPAVRVAGHCADQTEQSSVKDIRRLVRSSRGCDAVTYPQVNRGASERRCPIDTHEADIAWMITDPQIRSR